MSLSTDPSVVVDAADAVSVCTLSTHMDRWDYTRYNRATCRRARHIFRLSTRHLKKLEPVLSSPPRSRAWFTVLVHVTRFDVSAKVQEI